MQEELETLGVGDMERIFKLKRVSVYRRTSEARAGRGGFPLPIAMGGAKRNLRWNVADVRKFLQSTDDTPQTPPTLEIESAKSRQKRHVAAMKKLERFGIKVPQKAQE
jgi:hypothetical protein